PPSPRTVRCNQIHRAPQALFRSRMARGKASSSASSQPPASGTSASSTAAAAASASAGGAASSSAPAASATGGSSSSGNPVTPEGRHKRDSSTRRTAPPTFAGAPDQLKLYDGKRRANRNCPRCAWPLVLRRNRHPGRNPRPACIR
ncbi:unnamed protein product, partial [Ectocarpus sp. 12 AP-2014]